MNDPLRLLVAIIALVSATPSSGQERPRDRGPLARQAPPAQEPAAQDPAKPPPQTPADDGKKGEDDESKFVLAGLAADVNGSPITYFQLDRELNRLVRRHEVPREMQAEFRRRNAAAVREEMILNRLYLQQCDLLKVEVSEDQIDRFINDWISDLQADGAAISDIEEFFRKYLQDTGDSEEEVRQQVRDLLRIRALLSQKVYRREFITPQEMRAYYLAHQEEFTSDAVYEMRLLVLDRGPDLPDLIERVNADLAKKVPFSEIIARYSTESPRVRESVQTATETELKDYIDPLPDVVRSLDVGLVSPPINLGTTITYLQVTSRTPGKPLEFDTPEAQQQIERIIQRERRERRTQQYENELREKAQITRFNLGLFEGPRN